MNCAVWVIVLFLIIRSCSGIMQRVFLLTLLQVVSETLL